jgi:hypothetical protein
MVKIIVLLYFSCSTYLYVGETETLELHWSIFLAPFRRRLWFAVITAIVLLTTLLAISHKFRRYHGKADSHDERFWESFYSICGTFCCQGKIKYFTITKRHGEFVISKQ